MLAITHVTDLRKALFLAQLLQLLRSPNALQLCRQKLFDDIGPVSADIFAPATSSTPAYYVGASASISVMAIDGAVNLQLAQQTWDGWKGGFFTNNDFPTNAFMEGIATALDVVRKATIPGARDVDIITGFSLGGAVAQLLAAKNSPQFQASNTQIVTFGAPRPGSGQAVENIYRSQKARWFNDDDFIPLLPPRISYWTQAGIAVGNIAVNRFARFVHPGGGLMLGNTGGVTEGELPNIATVPSVAELGTAFATQDGTLLAPHAITEYQRRINAAIARETTTETMSHSTAPREQPEHNIARDIRRAEQRAESTIFNTGVQQNALPVVIPPARLFRAVRLGRTWWVYFGDLKICAAPVRKRAQGLAASGNDFLRRLQRQAVVDPSALTQQFVDYVALAGDPAAGFTPTLNTVLPG